MEESTSSERKLMEIGGRGGGEIKHAVDAVVMTSSKTLMTMAENLVLEMA